jgi:hypothetical protein
MAVVVVGAKDERRGSKDGLVPQLSELADGTSECSDEAHVNHALEY